LRPERATASALRAAASRLLNDRSYRRRTAELAKVFGSYQAHTGLAAALDFAMRAAS